MSQLADETLLEMSEKGITMNDYTDAIFEGNTYKIHKDHIKDVERFLTNMSLQVVDAGNQAEADLVEQQAQEDIDTSNVQRITPLFNGTYTVSSSQSKTHKVFRIRTCRSGNLKDKRIISIKDSNANFGWMGFGFVSDNGIQVWNKFKKLDNYSEMSRCLWSLVTERENSPYLGVGMSVQESCTCIRCNRELTDPVSIERGVGPECAGKI